MESRESRRERDSSGSGSSGSEGAGGRPFGWQAWAVLLGLVLLWGVGLSLMQRAGVDEISYTQFQRSVRQDRIAGVTITGQQIEGRYRSSEGGAKDGQTDRFFTVVPPQAGEELLTLLEEHGVTVRAESTESSWWSQALLAFLPWILILGLVIWGTRKMQEQMMGGGQRGGPFGIRRAQVEAVRKQENVATSFEDVAGVENAKRDLKEIIDYLREPERYRKLGAKVPHGVLLMGAPGTGKTLLARAVAGEADVPFFSISGSQFIELFVGVGAARVRELFQTAKRESPSIIFVDELDSIGRTRGTGLGGGHDEREQTLNQILAEMDGFSPHEAVVVLAATNRPDVLDPALLRPGRFDRKVTMELPGREARRRILEVHTRRVPLAEDVDLETLARQTVGFSGADLENLVNEAALLAGRERGQQVDMGTFGLARDRILLGAERDDVLSDDEKRRIATHEGGHALVAHQLPDADPLEKVTIIPRGRALGATQQLPEEDRKNLPRRYLESRLAVMLGGRVAERVVFGELTSGAESDLQQATELARRMICNWGMSERLGAVAFRRGEDHPFLGREMSQSRDFSERTAQLIDEEIQKLIGEIEKRTERLIREHRPRLDRLVESLLEQESLEGPALRELLDEAGADRPSSAASGNG